MTLIKYHFNLEIKRRSTLSLLPSDHLLHDFCLPYAFIAVCLNTYLHNESFQRGKNPSEKTRTMSGDIISLSQFTINVIICISGPRQLKIFLHLSEGKASQIYHLFHHCDNIILKSHQTRSIK